MKKRLVDCVTGIIRVNDSKNKRFSFKDTCNGRKNKREEIITFMQIGNNLLEQQYDSSNELQRKGM